MKLKYEFSINKIGDNYVAVPLGNGVVDFNGLLRLNETAAFIIKKLGSDITYEQLAKVVVEEFSCNEQEAKENIDSIISSLKEVNLLVE